MIKTLIIEDEPHAQRELQRLLDATSHDISLVGIADSIEEAIPLIQRNSHVDLIFMDIQLSDGLSFDIFEEIEVETPVIFTTAFDEYAIRAFKVNSVDYLLKPVEPEALQLALSKFEKNQVPQLPVKELMKAFQAQNKPSYKSRWAVRVGDKLKTYTADEIAYFYADDDALYLVPHRGAANIVDGTLSSLAERLDPKGFFQISRKLIVSYDCIQKVERYGASQYAIDINPAFPERVLVSRPRSKDFLNWLDQ